jgi:integrase/recombinase XerD
MITTKQVHIDQNHNQNQNALFDRKIDLTTAGLQQYYNKHLRDISVENASVICDYIGVMKTEINLSNNYRRLTIRLLVQLSRFHNQKSFNLIEREDILSLLDSLRKPESVDPFHKWVGTYNTYNMLLARFFKWLYSPNIEQGKRKKPKAVENIPRLKRKEKSVYKPSELWTAEEDLLFLKYCPSSRMRCYHMVERDTGCRPHEILWLKIKDITFKIIGDKQYAEVTVNGKTGTRTLPLIESIPYVKEYLSNGQHPHPGNPNAPLICGENRSLGRSIQTESLNHLYEKYKKVVYPRLLESPNVTPEDKHKIRELLKKPWNPYLTGRHTSLTAKSRVLKEATLRVFSGWTPNSDMPRRYVHLFGNAACEDLLEAYGLVDKSPNISVLQSKQCPNCSNPNRPDSKFCASCRMVLTFDAYNETLENQKEKEDRLTIIENQMKALLSTLENLTDQSQVNQLAQSLYDSHILKKTVVEE